MECNDVKCAAHGQVKVRGQVFTGKVVKDRMDKTIVLERNIVQYVPKYKRYMKVTRSLAAHNPACIAAKVGDTVQVGETRKLSKTKAFVVTQVVKPTQ